jgi:hypothetical protein
VFNTQQLQSIGQIGQRFVEYLHSVGLQQQQQQ